MEKLAEPLLPKRAITWLYERFLTGSIDQIGIWRRALPDAEVAKLSGSSHLLAMRNPSDAQRCLDDYREFHEASRRKDVAATERLGLSMRAFMARDRQRPVYHLTAPMDGIFDPAGAFFYKGRYHVFSYRNMVSLLTCTPLAHYVSDDLVHWRDAPIAIWADSDLDVQGIWLANLFLDDDQTPTMIYTALGERGKIGVLARSRDGLVSFGEKQAVMTDFVHHDGHTWKEGDTWYSITTRQYWGRRPGAFGDAIHLLTSSDLIHWTDRGEIFGIPRHEQPIDDHQRNGVAEFPYLIPFGDKHVLMVGTRPVRYWTGRFDRNLPAFIPDDPRGKLLDGLNPFHCFNPSIVDQKGEGGATRRIILAMNSSVGGAVEGIPWYGVHVLPRVLTRDGDRLVQVPAPEVERLRGPHFHVDRISVKESATDFVPHASGDTLEIIAEFSPGTAKRFGLKVRTGPKGENGTKIYYDVSTGRFGVEGGLKPLSKDPELGAAAAFIGAGEPVKLRVFLDRSLLEIFVNGQSMTGVFSCNPDDVGLDLFSEGGDATLVSLDAWKMKSIWPE